MSVSARRFLVVLPLVGLLAAVVLVAGAATSGASEPQLREARIREIALKAAATGGDRAPTLVQHAAGTRYRANLVASGDTVPDYQWSYLIAIRGHFILDNVPTPPGAPAPKCTVLTLVVDARSGKNLDFGCSDRYPHLSRLGPVHTDLRR